MQQDERRNCGRISVSCRTLLLLSMKLYSVLGCLFVAVLLLTGCQSARPVVLLPSAGSYVSAPVRPQNTAAPAEPAREATAADTSVPELTASLPVEGADAEARSVRPQRLALHTLKPVLLVAPDTSLVRQQTAGPTAEQIKAADSRTTTVNIFGVVLLVLGIGLLVAGISVGGWGGLALFVYGFVPLILSIPLMIFRSKNSTRRLANEKLKAERKAARNK